MVPRPVRVTSREIGAFEPAHERDAGATNRSPGLLPSSTRLIVFAAVASSDGRADTRTRGGWQWNVRRAVRRDRHRQGRLEGLRSNSRATGGGRHSETRTFATTTAVYCALRAVAYERQVSLVGMESTGVYWKPIYYPLEDRFDAG